MPIYEYQCPDCGHRFEAIQKFSDAPITTCPACARDQVKKLISATSFVLKGSGWYRDHYGLKSGGGGESASSGGSSEGASSSGSTAGASSSGGTSSGGSSSGGTSSGGSSSGGSSSGGASSGGASSSSSSAAPAAK